MDRETQQPKESEKALQMLSSGDLSGLVSMRPVIRDSWMRCRSYGLARAVPVAAKESIDIEPTRNEPARNHLMTMAEKIVCRTFEMAGMRDVGVALLDEKANLVVFCSSPQVKKQFEWMNLKQGSNWSERSIGTGKGTALVTGQLLRINPGEYYCFDDLRWYTEASPIYDQSSQRLRGILSVTWSESIRASTAIRLIRWGKENIEQAFREVSATDRLHLLDHYCQYETRFPLEALMAIDADGVILAVNSAMIRLSRQSISNLINHHVSSVLAGEIADSEGGADTGEMSLTHAGNTPVRVNVLNIKRQGLPVGRILLMQIPTTPKVRTSYVTADNPGWQANYTFDSLAGNTKAFREVVQKAQAAALTDLPILLNGESGTGKELMAQAIHNASRRANGPFVPVNCGAVTDELIGAELFGYEEGAFTGAARGGKRGKIQTAHGGTLFLDEVSSMPLKMQVSLLRILEDPVVVPIGGTRARGVDVRVIAATNEDPAEAIRQGKLRSDLYYRISVITIDVPPLRRRPEDVGVLAENILREARLNLKITPEALAILETYPWLGNVRELRNVILQAAMTARASEILPADLPSVIYSSRETLPETQLTNVERSTILRTLDEASGKLSLAASRLGIHRSTLYRKLRRYDMCTDKMPSHDKGPV